jgi:tetratricopeptide (TPR) repeat protein/transcriptional regulator with XRE-family HTH domain
MPVRKTAQSYPNLLLKRSRLEQGWSQQEVADRIGAPHAFMISRWENGTAKPGPEYRQKLCELFGKSLKELGFSKQSTEAVFAQPQLPIYDPILPFRLSTAQTIVGRDQLLADFVQRLSHQEERQLFALYGLPGVGKTTLAVELVNIPEIRHYFKDGILWAALGQQANILTILSRWGKLFDLGDGENRSLYSYDEWVHALRSAIGTRRMLFVIDDVWSLEEALKCKVGGPCCSYLLTTRIPEIAMYFAGDQAQQIPELGLNDGVKLITQIAPALVELNPDAPRMLVESVGGLPLALTLIGNYLLLQTRHFQSRRTQSALLQLQDTEKRLQLALPMMYYKQGTQQIPKVSLQTIIHMSEERLDERSRQALSALAVFPPKPDTFSEEAALAVAAVDADVLDYLTDVGMIEIGQQGRYQMHQVISDYERLQGRNREAEMRMLTYMINFAEQHKNNYSLLEKDLNIITGSIQLASEHKQHDLVMRGALACAKFLYDRGLQTVSETLLRQALVSAEMSNNMPLRAEILRDLTNIAKIRGNYKQAEKLAQECLSLLRSQKHAAALLSEILAHLGHILLLQGNYADAKIYLREGLACARQHKLSKQLCRSLGLLGVIAECQGDMPQAEQYWLEGLKIAIRAGEPESLAYICGVFGASLCDYKRYAEAEEYLQRGLGLAQQIGSRPEICHFLLDLGNLALKRGEYQKAETYLLQSLGQARAMCLHPALSAILLTLGELAIKHEEDEKAMRYLQEGFVFAQQKGNRYFMSGIASTKGTVYLKSKDVQKAEEEFLTALACVPEGNDIHRAQALYGLARVHLLRNERAQALEQGEQSLWIFEKIGSPLADEVRQWLACICPMTRR